MGQSKGPEKDRTTLEGASAHDLAPEDYMRLIPVRSPDAHKYSHGRVLIVGGSQDFPGAVALAVQAASKSGAGYVHSVVPEPIVSIVQLAALNAPAFLAPAHKDGTFAQTATSVVADHLGKADAVVIGCGMGMSEGATKVLESILVTPIPAVLDADALNIVAKDPELLVDRGSPTIITPHEGEAQRLAAGLSLTLSSKRGEAALQLAQAFGCVVVLKGPHSVTATAESAVVCPLAPAALATAGTGDVLAGIMGAILAQHASKGATTSLDRQPTLAESAALAVYLHASAGLTAQQNLGPLSVTAQDVIASLPSVFLDMSSSKEE